MVQLQVRWKGYGSDEDSWEPLKNLRDCKDTIQDFIRSNPKSSSLLPGFGCVVPAKRKRGQAEDGSKDKVNVGDFTTSSIQCMY